jgi:hypothetical protein
LSIVLPHREAVEPCIRPVSGKLCGEIQAFSVPTAHADALHGLCLDEMHDGVHVESTEQGASQDQFGPLAWRGVGEPNKRSRDVVWTGRIGAAENALKKCDECLRLGHRAPYSAPAWSAGLGCEYCPV